MTSNFDYQFNGLKYYLSYLYCHPVILARRSLNFGELVMSIVYIRGYPVCFVSKRINGKRVSIYRGCGELAVLAEVLWREDVQDRAERRWELQAEWSSFIDQVESLNRNLRRIYLENRRSVIDSMERLGFRFHRSSDFRLRKNKMKELTSPVEPVIDYQEYRFGNRSRYPSLAAFDHDGLTLRSCDPVFFERSRDHLYRTVITAVAEFVSDLMDIEEFDAKVTATALKAAELAGHYPNPTVKLAAEAAALAWLEATSLETLFMRESGSLRIRENDLGENVSELDRRKADRLGRLADRAFRRFNQSLKLLADVQRSTARIMVRTVTVDNMTASQTEIIP